ncbi:MAG TPA: hypothetical protein VJ958_05955 [Atribacterota bacterium]|nr:hypothetical protein [Atribacterota bacterium]
MVSFALLVFGVVFAVSVPITGYVVKKYIKPRLSKTIPFYLVYIIYGVVYVACVYLLFRLFNISISVIVFYLL